MAQPNVLLVTVDHWFASLLRTAGHPAVRTPTLDELADLGTRYTNAYSESPVCIPARRSIMTGTPPRTHGDRLFQPTLPMPELPTAAQAFRNGGYQTYAVGKLHVWPQRDRIGFDDVLLAEEGRSEGGKADDYETFLADHGHAGQQFGHGMSNNQYHWRPWHLPERFHVTNWCTQQMVRTIRRRDPNRPSFWYLSYTHPHPPLAPLRDYLDMYDPAEIDEPVIGDWAREDLPYALRVRNSVDRPRRFGARETREARRAFYALCTHIDHQLRLVIGTLREEGLQDSTAIVFTSDHGDMLGDHDLWAKRVFYERSANIPMIVTGPAHDDRIAAGAVDDRVVGQQDIMPTLLDLAGVAIPDSVEGRSMLGPRRAEPLYCEFGEGAEASRMVTDGRSKLIYYPAGNRVQLFDTAADPQELHDLSADPAHAATRDRLVEALRDQLYGSDLAWISEGELVGEPEPLLRPVLDRGLNLQRGTR
ncbi:sulfatase-like hydrolase/transferase [Saccharopolyspora erythraea]|uniref:sulfatase-like hydrolase/transferase n=1 Tax=Saccharopolyspora erythraea TaxID=1836 RepID=UPI0024AF180A|nr:sulfatase-like hydrolase/transferase [Saccharopolyspora erythraea]